MEEIKYKYVMSFKQGEGYIILSDKGAEEQAKKLWKNTKELKGSKIEVVMLKTEAMFLGMKSIKGGFELGILVYKGEPQTPNMNDMMRALTVLAMSYQDEY